MRMAADIKVMPRPPHTRTTAAAWGEKRERREHGRDEKRKEKDIKKRRKEKKAGRKRA